MPCRATQDGRVIAESSTKHDPLEDGMTNHPGTLAVRTSWNLKKAKKILHQKLNLPCMKVFSMLLGKSGAELSVAPERMKGMVQSRYGTQL